MDLNLQQAGSVILVGSNGQSFLIQNDSNLLNSVPCSESSILDSALQTIQSDGFPFNLNCTGNNLSQKSDNLSTNHQIVAILDENQPQTFEITSEQAAELGLQFNTNDVSKRKLILSNDSINSLSLSNSQEQLESNVVNNLFSTNFNLSIVNSAPSVNTNTCTTQQFLQPQFVDSNKKFTIEPTVSIGNTPCVLSCPKYPFLLQYNPKLDIKQEIHSTYNSQPCEKVDETSVPSGLLSAEPSAYDSVFLKEPIFNTVCELPNLAETLKGVKKKITAVKKPPGKAVPPEIQHKSASPSSLSPIDENVPEINLVLNQRLAPCSNAGENFVGDYIPCLETSNSPKRTQESPEVDVISLPRTSPKRASPSIKENHKNKSGSQAKAQASTKKQSKHETDERLDVTVNAQSLTKEQLKQIAQVFSKKRIMLDTKAPSRNVLYDPETNTRIICRVVYPEDLCKKKSGDSFVSELDKRDGDSGKLGLKKRGRPQKSKEETVEKPPLTTATTAESLKPDDPDQNAEKAPVQVSRITRSGRVSRPPRHISGDDGATQDDGNVSAFQSLSVHPESNSFAILSSAMIKKRNVSAEFMCPTCNKVYLGQSKMATHFEKWPSHKNSEWTKILSSKANKENNSNLVPPDGISKFKNFGKKKGKKRRPYEHCKILLKKALEDCSKSDVAALAGPIVASVLSVWEFLVLRSAKMKSDNENHVLALLRELKLLLNQIKSSAETLISPANGSTLNPELKDANQIEIRDDATSHVLGVPCGKYSVNSDYENNWLKSFSEHGKKLAENDHNNIKRLRPNVEENLDVWQNEESIDDTVHLSSTEDFVKGENDLNPPSLLLPKNKHSPADFIVNNDKIPNDFVNINDIMGDRLDSLRIQQQNELNDCFNSVDDLINNLSVNMGSMNKGSSKGESNSMLNSFGSVNLDKCDTSNCNLDLNFVNFQRSNDIMNDFNVISSLNDEQSSISKELNFVESGSGCSAADGPCSTSSLLNSSVSYVDSSLYDNMSSNLQFNNSDLMTNVSSSTEDLMKSLVSFELRPNDTSLNFDSMNQYSSVVMHDENVVSPSSASQLPSSESFSVGNSFDSAVQQMSNLVSSKNSKVSLKEDSSDDLDFVHSLDCLNSTI